MNRAFSRSLVLCFVVLASAIAAAEEQQYFRLDNLTRISGNGAPAGYQAGDSVNVESAAHNSPRSIAGARNGTLYVVESDRLRVIQQRQPGGGVKSIYMPAGRQCEILLINDTVEDEDPRELYCIESGMRILMKLTNINFTTLTYNTSLVTPNAGASAVIDGHFNDTRFVEVLCMSFHTPTQMYITDANVVRLVDFANQSVSIVAGVTGIAVTMDGVGTNATFQRLCGIAVARVEGVAYVVHCFLYLRKMDLRTRSVTTLGGRLGSLQSPLARYHIGMHVFEEWGTIVIAGPDIDGLYLVSLTDGVQHIPSQWNSQMSGDYRAPTSIVRNPRGVAAVNGTLYFTDFYHNVVTRAAGSLVPSMANITQFVAVRDTYNVTTTLAPQIAFSSNGSMYMTMPVGVSNMVISVTHAFETPFEFTAQSRIFLGFRCVSVAYLDATQRLYCTTTDNCVKGFANIGAATTELIAIFGQCGVWGSIPEGRIATSGVITAFHDDIIFADAGGYTHIARLNPLTGATKVIVSPAANRGHVVSPGGTVYNFVQTGAIYKFPFAAFLGMAHVTQLEPFLLCCTAMIMWRDDLLIIQRAKVGDVLALHLDNVTGVHRRRLAGAGGTGNHGQYVYPTTSDITPALTAILNDDTDWTGNLAHNPADRTLYMTYQRSTDRRILALRGSERVLPHLTPPPTVQLTEAPTSQPIETPTVPPSVPPTVAPTQAPPTPAPTGHATRPIEPDVCPTLPVVVERVLGPAAVNGTSSAAAPTLIVAAAAVRDGGVNFTLWARSCHRFADGLLAIGQNDGPMGIASISAAFPGFVQQALLGGGRGLRVQLGPLGAFDPATDDVVVFHFRRTMFAPPYAANASSSSGSGSGSGGNNATAHIGLEDIRVVIVAARVQADPAATETVQTASIALGAATLFVAAPGMAATAQRQALLASVVNCPQVLNDEPLPTDAHPTRIAIGDSLFRHYLGAMAGNTAAAVALVAVHFLTAATMKLFRGEPLLAAMQSVRFPTRSLPVIAFLMQPTLAAGITTALHSYDAAHQAGGAAVIVGCVAIVAATGRLLNPRTRYCKFLPKPPGHARGLGALLTMNSGRWVPHRARGEAFLRMVGPLFEDYKPASRDFFFVDMLVMLVSAYIVALVPTNMAHCRYTFQSAIALFGLYSATVLLTLPFCAHVSNAVFALSSALQFASAVCMYVAFDQDSEGFMGASEALNFAVIGLQVLNMVFQFVKGVLEWARGEEITEKALQLAQEKEAVRTRQVLTAFNSVFEGWELPPADSSASASRAPSSSGP